MRNTILCMLVRGGNGFVSGEEMSRTAGISRAAVWKHIESLKKDGYEIESVTKKGYRLANGPEMMETVFYRLPDDCRIGREHVYLEEIDSTSTYAKKASDSMPDGAVILADRQTAGRGRRGRQWDSAAGKGIWMSIVFKPSIQMSEAVMMTQMAGASVCDALLRLGYEAAIKWPNDIVIGGKKVCGILAEMEGEPEGLHHVIVGIGVNVNHQEQDFPEEIRNKATSLMLVSGRTACRSDILIEILTRLDYYYQCIAEHRTNEIIEFCRENSATLGREVTVISGDGSVTGKAVALTGAGGLIIEDTAGQAMEIISGEVSVRGIYGYV